ncbi:serine protease Do [Rhodopseudomonas julia]|uniref:Probable periplasmic serine endoprotease DegP-like n=1 Tax=Rhodopseudomonas julia TaxID=200617 RepID=A0ABU0C848_9BRAD|nr:serine protease Do [Rhodopseudomonas julia]
MGERNSVSMVARAGMGLVLAAMVTLTASLASARPVPESFADLAESLLDSVVNISTSQRVRASRGIPVPEVPEGSPFQEFFEDFFNRNQSEGEQPSRRVQSLGSGFVLDSSGLIVTNNHVIADADEIVANFADGTKLEAEVVGRDTKTDLALLKVNPPHPLKAVEFGDSEHLRIGDWVMAIGNPFGFGGTVTVGIVSALERDINSGPYDKFIQTDASINRGNSGGPLFNLDGKVVGINTAIISPTGGSIGIGFAVPAEIAMPVIEQLREFGETRRGWLGVRIQEVTDEIAESLGMDKAEGALIAGVTDGGPAAEAGIQAGDVIIDFDGREVASMRELPSIVADTPVGKDVEVTLLRKGEKLTVTARLGRLEEEQTVSTLSGDDTPGSEMDSDEAVQMLGLTLEPLSDDARSEYGIADDIEGVLISSVEPGSAAEENQIAAGDVIVEVSQEAVTEPEDVTARIERLRAQDRQSALFLIASPDGDLRFVAIRLDDLPSDNAPAEESPEQ